MVNFNFALVNEHGETYIEVSREHEDWNDAIDYAEWWLKDHPIAGHVVVSELPGRTIRVRVDRK